MVSAFILGVCVYFFKDIQKQQLGTPFPESSAQDKSLLLMSAPIRPSIPTDITSRMSDCSALTPVGHVLLIIIFLQQLQMLSWYVATLQAFILLLSLSILQLLVCSLDSMYWRTARRCSSHASNTKCFFLFSE